MNIDYDSSIDAAYIHLGKNVQEGEVKNTYPCDPIAVDGEINLDFDSDGRLIGIEVQNASKTLRTELFANKIRKF